MTLREYFNPNSKIPALVDNSGEVPIKIFESGAILLYLAQKFGKFFPQDKVSQAECTSWLFWQMGSTPYLGGGFGHFYAYAPYKQEYPINRFAMETKRQLDVLDKRLEKTEKRPLLLKGNLNETVNKIYLARKKTYSESDFRIKCNFETKENIIEKIFKLYENSKNKS